MQGKKSDDYLLSSGSEDIEYSINQEQINKIPLKPIKRILKAHYEGEVSLDACSSLRDSLINFAHFLAEETTKEFRNSNNIRKKLGLQPLKRLDRPTFLIVKDRFFKTLDDLKCGEVGQYNELLLCPDGDIIERNRKDIIIKDDEKEGSLR